MKILGIVISLLALLALVARGELTPSAYGLKFDGKNDQVHAGTFGNYGSAYMAKGTIELWGKIESTSVYYHYGVVTSSEEDQSNEWGIWTRNLNNTGNWAPSFYIADTDRAELSGYAAGVKIDDGKWHHVAVTWDCAANTIKIYVDGKSKEVTYVAQ